MPENEPEDWDIVIIGAGAAGLFAAIAAAELGVRVLLLEKNRRPGVKILMSGGTRCNLTNARGLRSLAPVSGPIDPLFPPKRCRGTRVIAEAFGAEGARFLTPSLRALDVDATVGFFEASGLATKVEATGKIFPVSDSAADVLAAIVAQVERAGATVRCESPAKSIVARDRGFDIQTEGASITAARVIISTGGRSYPGCGTTGDGYAMASAFGHTIVEPRPALVPIRVDAPWVAPLRGITVEDVRLAVIDAAGISQADARGAMLFAHFGLTGPCALDISRAIARAAPHAALRLKIDWRPERNIEQIDAALQSARSAGRVPVASLLELPRRLAETLLQASGVPAHRITPDLTRPERQSLLQSLKRIALPIAGTLGFEKAEVTTGGVALGEVDAATLESRLRPGLHLIGEVLDLDGPIGGYNFQAAWSMGRLAGQAAARRCALDPPG